MPFTDNDYTLPAGSLATNGAVSNATTQHNAPLTDIATALSLLKLDSYKVIEAVGDVVSVTQFGAIGDGVTNDAPAFNAALATGFDVAVPWTAMGYKIAGALTLTTNGQTIFGTGRKRSKLIIPTTLMTVTAVDDVILRDLVFYGSHDSSAYHSTFTNCHNWRIEKIRWQNVNSCMKLDGCDGWSWDVDFWELRGTAVQLNPGSRHTVHRCDARNNASFTWWLQSGSDYNQINGLKRYVYTPTLTAYQSALESQGVPTSVSGRLGFEAVGIRFGSNNNVVFGPIILNPAENGISFSGNRNQMNGGYILNPELVGVGVYGTYNDVSNVKVFGGGDLSSTSTAFLASANAGGIGRHNTFSNCEAFNNRAGFTIKQDAYPTWTSGGAGVSSYCKAVDGAVTRIYRKVSGGTTYGTVKPVHEGADTSDGLVVWQYLNKVTGGQNLNSQNNLFNGCVSTGNTDDNFFDDSGNYTNHLFDCRDDNVWRSTNATARSRGYYERRDATISGAELNVSGSSWVRATNAGTINTFKCDDDGLVEVFITAQTGTVTITHEANTIRCRGGANQSIVANQGGLTFFRNASGVWEQAG